MDYKTTGECRICRNTHFESIIDLGDIYPSNFVQKTEGFEKVPLVLVRCLNCGLVQLLHEVNLDSMYRQYYYRSGLNPTMVKALDEIVRRSQWYVELEKGDTVLDIGCNDGTLFGLYPKGSKDEYNFIGYDPALNLADEAKRWCSTFVNDYFSIDTYDFPKAKIITSIAMFYDLPDPVQFVSDIRNILHDDGIWVIQFTDLVSMLKINAFDNICHEHLEYYSLRDVINLLNWFELEVISLDHNRINGGSLQLFVAHKGKKKVQDGVKIALNEEERYLDPNRKPFIKFRENVETIKSSVMGYLRHLEKQRKIAYGLGASTKGNTLLQYFGIENGRYIQKIADINEEKWGLKTIGTNIPIISEKQALEESPTTFLVLPWHFIEGFTKKNEKLMEYLNTGSFTVPMPKPAIYFRENGNLYKMFLDTGLEDKVFNRANRGKEALIWA